MNTCDGNPFSKSLDTGIFWSRKPATGPSDKVTLNSIMRIPTWEQYMVQHTAWCYIRVIYILPLELSIFSGIIIALCLNGETSKWHYLKEDTVTVPKAKTPFFSLLLHQLAVFLWASKSLFLSGPIALPSWLWPRRVEKSSHLQATRRPEAT